ncbi:MAG: Rpn family recombination-promoting nuclease/putative transposase [Chitinophagales bacterium]
MLKERYMNPFTDFGFKKLFGSEANKDLLIHFLNSLLPPQHQIIDLSYTPNERLGSLELDRRAIFDLYCTGSNGDRFIVELQKAKQNYFKDRSVFYASFPIQEQAKKGNWNFQLSAVYLIGLLDFVFREEELETSLRHEVQLKDQRDRVFFEKLTFIYLEIPNFKRKESELEGNFDKWLYALQQMPDLYERPSNFKEEVFKKLFEVSEIARFSLDEQGGYAESRRVYQDLKNAMETSYGEGLHTGMERGLKLGREQGKQELVRKMLKAGVARASILEALGWSSEELTEWLGI